MGKASPKDAFLGKILHVEALYILSLFLIKLFFGLESPLFQWKFIVRVLNVGEEGKDLGPLPKKNFGAFPYFLLVSPKIICYNS